MSVLILAHFDDLVCLQTRYFVFSLTGSQAKLLTYIKGFEAFELSNLSPI